MICHQPGFPSKIARDVPKPKSDQHWGAKKNLWVFAVAKMKNVLGPCRLKIGFSKDLPVPTTTSCCTLHPGKMNILNPKMKVWLEDDVPDFKAG